MSNVLVTGATGFVGKQLALRLAGSGHKVHAMYRSEANINELEHPNIRLFKGTLTDLASIDNAMKGCDQVYHLAAFAAVWTRKPEEIYEQNVQGTTNILESALKHGVKKVVHTSTAGVFGPSGEKPNSEDNPIPETHFVHYDRSKARAEETINTYVRDGMDVIIVNPTRVFGPGKLGDSNGVTRMIRDYIKGKWHIIPGSGQSVGNYVYIDDVVEGHILAMEKGRTGERYLLGGSDLSFNEFFNILKEVTGSHYFLIKVPLFIGISIAAIMLTIAKLTGRMPLITPGLLKRYSHHWAVSSEKARSELGYDPVDFREGLRRTVEWLQTINIEYGK
jgi:nucleoside-diphosphate-sugar epimerase